MHTPSFDLPIDDPSSGWCYSDDPAVAGDCGAKGFPGTTRFLGNVTPSPGSDDSISCIWGATDTSSASLARDPPRP